jgi:hypothetical protein
VFHDISQIECDIVHRANLEKMEDKELAVVLHHLDQKTDTARRAVSEISMLHAQLMQQVAILHQILHTIHFTSLNVIACL